MFAPKILEFIYSIDFHMLFWLQQGIHNNKFTENYKVFNLEGKKFLSKGSDSLA